MALVNTLEKIESSLICHDTDRLMALHLPVLHGHPAEQGVQFHRLEGEWNLGNAGFLLREAFHEKYVA